MNVEVKYEETVYATLDLDEFIEEYKEDYEDWLEDDLESVIEDTPNARIEFLETVLYEDPYEADWILKSKKYSLDYDKLGSVDVRRLER